MIIKDGGRLDGLSAQEKLTGIRVCSEEGRIFAHLWLNDISLSYLSVSELLDLKQEIQDTLRSIIGA